MSLEKLERQLQKNIGEMIVDVAEARHEYVTLEHLLLALLDNTKTCNLLKSLGSDTQAIEHQLRIYFERYLAQYTLPPRRPQRSQSLPRPANPGFSPRARASHPAHRAAQRQHQ